MSINSEIRKIAKAWGVDTKGSSIKDALKDLRTNLPFGTKTEMVEVFPLQTFTGEPDEYEACEISTDDDDPQFTYFELKPGVKHSVYINGEEFTVIPNSEYEGSWNVDIGDIETDKYAYMGGYVDGSSYAYIGWGKDFGETITLAIYEEQEVITPIDPKFVGSATFLTYSGDDELRYARRYNPVTNELGEKVTKEELLNAMVRGVVYTTGSYSYEGNYGYIYPIEMIQFVSDYASIRISGSGTSNYLYTSEYTEASGPK